MPSDVPTWEEVVRTDVPEVVTDHFALMERMPVEVAMEVERRAAEVMSVIDEVMPSK